MWLKHDKSWKRSVLKLNLCSKNYKMTCYVMDILPGINTEAQEAK